MFVASLAGGYRDWLVDSDSADLSSVMPLADHYLFTHTLAVPEVWMEQDHLVSNEGKERVKGKEKRKLKKGKKNTKMRKTTECFVFVVDSVV